jgi:hypothetical protein
LIGELSAISFIRNSKDVFTDKDKFRKADWSKDYAIGVWRSEWMEYYFSWSKSFETNNYSWTDAIQGFLTMVAIAFFPLIFWWLNIKKKSSP